MMAKPPPSTNNSTPPLIRASELSYFDFCQRAWWLSTVKKITPGNAADRKRGQRFHQRHTQQIVQAQRWRGLGRILLGLGLILFFVALLLVIT